MGLTRLTREMLASIYQFATLNDDWFDSSISQVLWKAYGILAMRTSGTLEFEMTLDAMGCTLTVLWQTCDLNTLGQEIGEILGKIA